MIEGELKSNAKVVVIEDLISSGGSALKAVKSLEDAGAEVLGVMAIFSYELSVAKENFNRAGTEFLTLTNLSSLIDVALKRKIIKSSDIGMITNWRETL